MNLNKLISTLTVVSALSFASAAQAADNAAPTRGQVSVSGPAVKVVVYGPVAIHAYSGYSGGTVYAARSLTGTDADCKTPVSGTSQTVKADTVIDFQVGAGQVACLATNTARSFELLWHAQKDLPAPGPVMLAKAGR